MIKTETIKLGDNVYSCTQLPAKKALKAMSLLTKFIVDPAILRYDDKAIVEAFKKVTDNEFLDFVIEMCEYETRIMPDGDEKRARRIKFDEEFSGNLMEMWLFFIFVLRVNFQDFFEDAIGLINGNGKYDIKAVIPQKMADKIKAIM